MPEPQDAAPRRVFREDQCHHRVDGILTNPPDCELPRLKPANMCQEHERVWQIAAKARREERIRTGTPAPNARSVAAPEIVQLTLDSLPPLPPAVEDPEATSAKPVKGKSK
jgi:hypothetical protein